ncbi:MAG: S-methyl-5-thioribose-1-phosphate isomerase [Actinobacteria bacterium]|nr:S-methyl-5-thioribose-1-phosphate isomerase [Actinomycetota bacterium]
MIWERPVLKLIDQRKLPFEEVYFECRSIENIGEAIVKMIVRGAPAIGITAAYGIAIAALGFKGNQKEGFIEHLYKNIDYLSKTRPTAVNLFWALDRMKKLISGMSGLDMDTIREGVVGEAEKIEKEDLEINHMLGDNGLKVFESNGPGLKILTHCNAGALAASGYGTALAVIRSLHKAGRIANVIVDETRPFLQGARLTAWELHQEKIPFFIISDNMAGYFMSKGEVDAVVVGADRVAANGDSANKIGTLSLSVLARYYGIAFYVVAPISTIDINTANGGLIPIEERDGREVREVLGKVIIPEYMQVRNPAFDIAPADNITAIITEAEVLYPPFDKNIKKIFDSM